jgi:hypothetical protein
MPEKIQKLMVTAAVCLAVMYAVERVEFLRKLVKGIA